MTAIVIRRTGESELERYRTSLDLWDCQNCHAPIGVACGHIPLACPSCGVKFSSFQVDGILRPVELHFPNKKAG